MLRGTVFLLCVVVAAVSCSGPMVFNARSCPNEPQDKCTVKEVRIDPCQKPTVCRLKKGKPAAISFDYIPNFSATKLNNSVSYNGVEFPDLDTNACVYTTCPAVSGQQATLNYDLSLSTKLPNGQYPVEWKVWDANDRGNICCFGFTLKLVK